MDFDVSTAEMLSRPPGSSLGLQWRIAIGCCRTQRHNGGGAKEQRAVNAVCRRVSPCRCDIPLPLFSAPKEKRRRQPWWWRGVSRSLIHVLPEQSFSLGIYTKG
jgi:hypothetical protein